MAKCACAHAKERTLKTSEIRIGKRYDTLYGIVRIDAPIVMPAAWVAIDLHPLFVGR